MRFDPTTEVRYSCKKYKNKEAKKFILTEYRNILITNEILKDTS